MKKRLSVLALAVSAPAIAGEWRLLTPRDVYIDAYRNQTVHDPYLDPVDASLGYGSTFSVDTDILKYKYWGIYSFNKLHFDQNKDTGKIVHGGWEYEVGMSLFPSKIDPKRGQVEVFQQHHSRHIFEDYREEHFPVYDRYGIRLRIWP
jgi:hypothetical protein